MAVKHYVLNDEQAAFILNAKDSRMAWRSIAQKMSFRVETLEICETAQPGKIIFCAEEIPIGMYELDQPGSRQITIGGHTLVRHDAESFWIREDESGEGGQFSETALAAVIKEFYDKHF